MAGAQTEEVWGVDFSQSQAEYLGLDWKEVYLAILEDLKVKHIKLHTNWSWVEGEKDVLEFGNVDWQIAQAEQHDVKLIYVLGFKTGRWPECHAPGWLQSLSKEEQKQEILRYIEDVVNRYKDSDAITHWQVENEPFVRFGECPRWYYENADFLKEEVALVKKLDPTRPIIVSDSGELSTWFEAAQIGDIVGVTMYRSVWKEGFETFGINPYAFLHPRIYAEKAEAIHKLFGKPVIGIELQAEPWASKPLAEASLAEQMQSMNAEMFKENVEFARGTRFTTIYFWGVEWWYWMKVKHNHPEIWEEAKTVFSR